MGAHILDKNDNFPIFAQNIAKIGKLSFLSKICQFYCCKNRCLLHGHVFVMFVGVVCKSCNLYI